VQTIFSTAAVHPRDRFDCWHNAACRSIINHESTPECRQTFQAELQSGSLADIGLVLFENSSMTISHTSRDVAHTNTDYLFVCRQAAGVLALRQGSHEVVLEPGDITLVDPRAPYAGKFSVGSRLLLLKIPRRLLESRIGKTGEMTACTIKPTAGENGLTSAFLAMLPTHAGGLGPPVEEVVRDQVLDLVAVSLANATEGGRPRLSSSRSLALIKVRAAIDARLTDPDLDSKRVAAAAGVSVRYANAMLAEQGTSVMRLIQERRLARCKRALDDPQQHNRTVSEIAYSWGFSDMTHFGRRFRAAFGLLPSEYRKVSKAG
jgi:AraC family transcriptional regulator, positive regulator of tynA and feaB